MNHMKEVAALLGIEFKEVFRLRVNKALDGQPHMVDKEYKLTPEGLFMTQAFGEGLKGWMKAPETLAGILKGDYSIVKSPWTPKVHEVYYYCTPNDEACSINSTNFEPHFFLTDNYNVKVGNCFRTKEEAAQHLAAFKEWLKDDTKIDQWREKI